MIDKLRKGVYWVAARVFARPAAKLFHYNLIRKTGNFEHVTWVGNPIWQHVLDLWTIQETISEVKPALLIESGTNRGGSALYYAQLMDLLGTGRVVTIDIEKMHSLQHPRIEWVIGSSTDPETFEHVRAAAESAEGPVMVILDADHSTKHVAKELELYGQLVTPGSYLLSQDGAIDADPLFSGARPGPLRANRDFLERHPEFEHDKERNDRFLVTYHPLGWMRKKR